MASSPQTLKCTSIDELKDLETFASICTTLPSLIGASKEILSTEAVTTGTAQCFMADSAAAISIQYIRRPPIRLPCVLVSLGNTSSVIMIKLPAGFFASMDKKFKQRYSNKNKTLCRYY